MIEKILETSLSFIPYAIGFVIYLIKHERRLTRIETNMDWLIRKIYGKEANPCQIKKT